MKKILFLFTLSLLLCSNLFSQWINKPTNTFFDFFDCHFINVNTGYVVGYGNTILKTIDGGNNWINLSFPTTANNINCVFFFDANTGFIGSTNDTILKTTNGGINWLNISAIGFQSNKITFVNQNTGWAAGFNSIAKTTNAGMNWIMKNINSNGSLFFINEMTGWTADYNSGSSTIYKSTDGGNAWNSQRINPDFKIIYAFYFLDANTGWAVGYRENILKTTDGGSNWTTQRDIAGGAGLYSVYFVNQNTGWIAGDFNFGGGSEVLYTTNGGDIWIENFLSVNAGRLSKVQFVNTYTGYMVGQYGSVFRTDNTGGLTNINVNTENIPQNYELKQNYPNPFNPQTNINYSLKENGFVTLKIFNILGRKIVTLVNGTQNDGNYKISFDADKYSISSGIYYYELNVNNFHSVKKMILIK